MFSVSARPRVWAAALACAFLGLSLSACGDSSDSGGSGSSGKTIAFLLPQSGVPRFEKWDKPFFEAKIKAECPDCKVLYYNAVDEDSARQQQQAEAALANGASVLVIAPVDGEAAKVIADAAAAVNVPVVSYERLVLGSDNVKAFTTHDSIRVGKVQAESLIEGMTELGHPEGPVLMVNGSPTNTDAADFKKGATDAFNAAGVKILESFDTPDWDPAKAQAQMEQWITQYGKDGFAGVYAADGGTAGGVIAAMQSAGVDPSQHPVTGQDGDLSEIQRILTGDQYMTIFRPLQVEADLAAEAALNLLDDKALPSEFSTEKSNDSGTDVPTAVLPVVAVDKSNIMKELVDTGYFTVAELCAGDYAAPCAAAGVK